MRISGNRLFLRCNEHPRRLNSRLWINKLLAGCHQLCVGNTTVNLGRPNCLFHYHRESKLCKYLPLSTLKIAQNGGFVKKNPKQTRLQLSNEKGLALFLKSSDPSPSLPCPISFSENKHPYSSTLQSTKPYTSTILVWSTKSCWSLIFAHLKYF